MSRREVAVLENLRGSSKRKERRVIITLVGGTLMRNMIDRIVTGRGTVYVCAIAQTIVIINAFKSATS